MHTSAAGIVGDTSGSIIDETHAPQPVPPVRWRADNETFALGLARSNIRAAVVAAMRTTLTTDGYEARAVFSFFGDLARADIMVRGAKARENVGWRITGSDLLDDLRAKVA